VPLLIQNSDDATAYIRGGTCYGQVADTTQLQRKLFSVYLYNKRRLVCVSVCLCVTNKLLNHATQCDQASRKDVSKSVDSH